jgi:hypothetical protein
MPHCWKDKAEYAEEQFGVLSAEWADAFDHSGTCMLEFGHSEQHEFTDDDQIGVKFEE